MYQISPTKERDVEKWSFIRTVGGACHGSTGHLLQNVMDFLKIISYQNEDRQTFKRFETIKIYFLTIQNKIK